MKKRMAVLLAIVILLVPAPFPTFAETRDSGSCGDDVTWKVETTYVSNRDKLTISGTGSMDDFSKNDRPPWEAYQDRIGTVIIESGVGRIGEYAFYNYGNLDYVIFHGDTPPDIAENAFSALQGEGVIVHPEGKGDAYDIWRNTEISSWHVREPGHTETTSVTVKIPVAGESPDTFITGESWQYYYGVAWWTPEDPGRQFDGEYQAGDDYYVIVELLNDYDFTDRLLGGMVDYKNGLLPLDGFTVNGQPVELYLGRGPFELSSIEDIKVLAVFRNTTDFVPVTNIQDVPLEAAVGYAHTLSGTVVPDNATYQDMIWSITNDGGTGAVLAGDGKTITGLTNEGTVTVTATVPLGGERIPDPANPEDSKEDWPYQDYTQEFDITVTDPVAPTISGPPSMSLTQGYAATATEPFTVTGNPAPDVSVSGDTHITWSNMDKKLEIATGLTSGDYPVTLTASNGVDSDAVVTFTLTVTAPPIVNAGSPTITQQPKSATVVAGTSHTLTVEATSPDGGDLSYQWYESSTASNSGGRKIDGAIDASYTPPTDAAGHSYYYVVVTNTNNGVNGATTASAVSVPATLTVSPQSSGTVTGEIGYEHNDPPFMLDENIAEELDVIVTLWQNDALISSLEKMALAFSDDVVQYYSFTDVDDGWYTVVADSYIGENLFYTITRDVYVNDGRMIEEPEPIIFTPGKTQTILEIAEGVEAQNVTTNDLPDLFETDHSGNYNPQYTVADRNHLASGGEVEFNLHVSNAFPTDQSLLSDRITADGYASVLFVDLTLTKTLRDMHNSVVGTPSPIPNVIPALLEIVVPMISPQTITAVYRIHESEAPAALPNGASNANAYGEYFRYDAEKNTVYLYVNQFSAYAFAVGTGNDGGSNPSTGAEDDSDVPQTGDNSNRGCVWYVMLGASVLSLIGLIFFCKRQRKTE